MNKNLEDPSYLLAGNSRQKLAFETMEELKIFKVLSLYDPILVGTVPIGIDIDSSDLDIICHITQEVSFESEIIRTYGNQPEFEIRKTTKQGKDTVIASFKHPSFRIEIFAQNVPSTRQWAYLHMVKEHEILASRDESFKQEVISLKKEGLSTEEAFARLLGIEGDPYLGLLKYKV